MKNIIWDWNGTLLDDVNVSVETMNTLLADYGLPLLSRDAYREIFCFPITEYYRRIRLDTAGIPFEVLANRFIEIYNSLWKSAKLYDGAESVLRGLDGKCRQYIVSASERGNLLCQVKHYGIDGYFDEICGIGDCFARSKVEIARGCIERHSLEPDETLFVGDTLHDLEVADAVGCRCVLISAGHQSKDILRTSAAPNIENIAQLPEFIRKLGKESVC